MLGFAPQAALRPARHASRIFCSNATQNQNVRTAVSIALFNAQRSVLLIRRGQEPNRGRWSLPGGRVNDGEALRAAALRELEEETGVREDFVEVSSVPLEETVCSVKERPKYVVHVFRAQLLREVQPVAADDADDARFYALEDIPGLHSTDGLAGIVTKLSVNR